MQLLGSQNDMATIRLCARCIRDDAGSGTAVRVVGIMATGAGQIGRIIGAARGCATCRVVPKGRGIDAVAAVRTKVSFRGLSF